MIKDNFEGLKYKHRWTVLQILFPYYPLSTTLRPLGFSAKRKRRLCLEQVERIPLQRATTPTLIPYRRWVDASMRYLPEKYKNDALRNLQSHLAHSLGLVVSEGNPKKLWEFLPKYRSPNNYFAMHGCSLLSLRFHKKRDPVNQELFEIGRLGLLGLVNEKEDELGMTLTLRKKQRPEKEGQVWDLVNRLEKTFDGARQGSKLWKTMRKDPTKALGRFLGELSHFIEVWPSDVLQALPRIDSLLGRFKSHGANFTQGVTEDQHRPEEQTYTGMLWPHVFLAKPHLPDWQKRATTLRGTEELLATTLLGNSLRRRMPQAHRQGLQPYSPSQVLNRYYRQITPAKYSWVLTDRHKKIP